MDVCDADEIVVERLLNLHNGFCLSIIKPLGKIELIPRL